MTATESRARFRNILAGNSCVNPASVFDPISARIAEDLGFEVGMLAGSIASATVLGAPDLIVLTLTEFADQARRITRSADLSLMVDADHGYGNALNVIRTVEEMENAGVSALTLEDTLLPQTFGAAQETALIATDEMIGKLRAALSARKDPSLIIVGRTTIPASGDIDSAINRIKAYDETGIDAVFVVGLRNPDHLKAINNATTLPLMLGSTPPELNDTNLLATQGVRIALTGHMPFQAAVKAVYDVMSHLKSGGSILDLQEKVASDALLAQLTRRPRYSQNRKDYLNPG